MKFVFILLLLMSVPLTYAQEALKEKMDSIVNSKLGDNDPGLMVGVVKDGAIIYENYKGLASLQHQVKITEQSRSNIASTAKQFTALMILQLSHEQKLNLEDDIRKYLPNL